MDDKGQISLEYVIIIMIGILVLIFISFPLVNLAIDNSNDVIDSINCKNELTKVADSINYCYSSGRGSKRVVLLEFNKNVTVNFFEDINSKSIIKSEISLNNEIKTITVSTNAEIVSKKIQFSKGFNKVIIKWDENSNSIIVNKI